MSSSSAARSTRSFFGLSSRFSAADRVRDPSEASTSFVIHSSGSRPVASARAISCLAYSRVP